MAKKRDRGNKLGNIGKRKPAGVPLYVRCVPCQVNPDRACPFCTDGYILTGYDEERLDNEIKRGDTYLLLLNEVAQTGIVTAALTGMLKRREKEIEAAKSRTKT